MAFKAKFVSRDFYGILEIGREIFDRSMSQIGKTVPFSIICCLSIIMEDLNINRFSSFLSCRLPVKKVKEMHMILLNTFDASCSFQICYALVIGNDRGFGKKNELANGRVRSKMQPQIGPRKKPGLLR